MTRGRDEQLPTGKTEPSDWREPQFARIGERLRKLLARGEQASAKAGGTPSPPELHSPTLCADELDELKMAYLHSLRERYGAVRLYGLDARRRALQGEGQALDLLAIYTPLNTRLQEANEKGSTGETSGSDAQETELRSALQIVGRHPRVIVRGPHGAGKSTLSRALALCLADRLLEREPGQADRLLPEWAHDTLFPVLVDLRTYAAQLAGGSAPDSLLDYIADDLSLNADQFYHQLIVPGGLMFILDGIGLALEQVETLIGMVLDTPNRIVLTALPYVGTDVHARALLADFATVALTPWALEQMETFARRWYAELERQEWIDRESARDLPGQLCSALRRPEIGSLTGRPSLMMLIALLHTTQGRLPPDRVTFYHELIDHMITYWSAGGIQEERDLRQVFDLDNLRDAVALATYQAYAHLAGPDDLVELSEADLRAILVSICRDERWGAVSDLVSRILSRPGLLDEKRPGVYSYPDPLLQAYVASRQLTTDPELPRRAVQLVREDLARWRPVLLFAVARLARFSEQPFAALDVVDALCPYSLRVGRERGPAEQDWQRAWLAGEALLKVVAPQSGALRHAVQLSHKEQAQLPRLGQMQDRVREWLVALVQEGHLAPCERAQAGSVLDRLGDPRDGVSTPSPVWCPVEAGPFWYGPEDAAHVVELHGFWISRYPVTNAQYEQFCTMTRHRTPSHWPGDRPPPGLGNHPVVNVSWHDATAYCAWMAEHLPTPGLLLQCGRGIKIIKAMPRGWVVRLPMGAEWAKSARGGIQVPSDKDTGTTDNPYPRRRYPWGDSWQLSTRGTAGDEMRCNVSESGIGITTPVGMYPTGASPYGVLDMAGNVWEWCLEWADPEGRYKVRRGGAFRYTHEHARCAASDHAHPGLAWPYLGFRIVLGPPVEA